jgi:hypothetical protein
MFVLRHFVCPIVIFPGLVPVSCAMQCAGRTWTTALHCAALLCAALRCTALHCTPNPLNFATNFWSNVQLRTFDTNSTFDANSTG